MAASSSSAGGSLEDACSASAARDSESFGVGTGKWELDGNGGAGGGIGYDEGKAQFGAQSQTFAFESHGPCLFSFFYLAYKQKIQRLIQGGFLFRL